MKPQLPITVEDRGDSWLVKGTPYDLENSRHHMSYMFLRKDTAEVTGILSVARMVPTQGWDYWSRYMSRADYARVFGPPTSFEPNGIHELILAAYGGLINTPADAVEYAYTLMQTKPELAAIAKGEIEVKETETPSDKVWHVFQHQPDRRVVEVLSFSRKTGRLLSGDL